MRLPRLGQPPFSVTVTAFQVVGVVHDAEPRCAASGTASDPAGITRAVIAQVYAIDRNQPVTNVKTLEQLLGEKQYARPRFDLTLLSVFAAVGLLLAVGGVYGVMASAVAQERHEIAVRLALGARAGAIARMVVARGVWLLLIGTVAGLAGKLAVARLLARQVWNGPPFDPAAFAIVSAILLPPVCRPASGRRGARRASIR
jgi:putative ABC transport system permease protein